MHKKLGKTDHLTNYFGMINLISHLVNNTPIKIVMGVKRIPLS
jgi:hypothetical protein